MGSIFVDFSAHIRATSCPEFKAEIVKESVDSQTEALKQRYEFMLKDADSPPPKSLAVEFVGRNTSPFWKRALFQHDALFKADLSTFPNEVGQMIQTLASLLPQDVIDAIETAPLFGAEKYELAKLCATHLDQYKSAVEQRKVLLRENAKNGAVETDRRIQEAKERWKQRQCKPVFPTHSFMSSGFTCIPSQTTNTYSTQPKYFRILVWNLENFTRDARPRGTQPLDSMRNQARIAIVAELASRLNVDLLLMMETGSDVGPLCTQVEREVLKRKKGDDPRPWHPLVSPPTGAMQEIPLKITNQTLGRPGVMRLSSLCALAEVYRISPAYAHVATGINDTQLKDAWNLFKKASPEARRFPEYFNVSPHFSLVGFAGAPAHGPLAAFCDVLIKFGSFLNQNEDYQYVVQKCSELIGELKTGYVQTYPEEIAHTILCVRDLVIFLRKLDDSDPCATLILALEAIDLWLLFTLKCTLKTMPTKQSIITSVFDSVTRPFSLPLGCCMLTTIGHVDMASIDRKIGPAGGVLDNDVLIGALQRIGAVKRNIETYGMLYREPYPTALQHLFDMGCFSHVGGEDLEEESCQYGIIQTSLSKGTMPVQQVGGHLNWRSGLQITVPLKVGLALPMVLYHTRFTSSAAVKNFYDEGVDKDKETLARYDSILAIAKAVIPGSPKWGMPIILGDFNTPSLYLNKEDGPSNNSEKVVTAWKRRQTVRDHLATGMAKLGYLRHTSGGAYDRGFLPTSLKAYGSIALGQTPENETYDGVYEPFDCCVGQGHVRSGIISISGILDMKVVTQSVTGVLSTTNDGDVIDPDREDNDDRSNDQFDPGGFGDDEVVVQNVPQVQARSGLIQSALAIEVGRIYRSMFRKLLKPFTDLLIDIVKLLQRWVESDVLDRYGVINGLIDLRVKWFVTAMGNNSTLSFQTATGRDFLSEWRDALANLEFFAKESSDFTIKKETVITKAKEAADMAIKQVTNMETDNDIRNMIAYRAVVSDHLPQIIEIDLLPQQF
jgi:hypothetical protein